MFFIQSSGVPNLFVFCDEVRKDYLKDLRKHRFVGIPCSVPCSVMMAGDVSGEGGSKFGTLSLTIIFVRLLYQIGCIF